MYALSQTQLDHLIETFGCHPILQLKPIVQKPVHQFRKEFCSDWYDGLPDNSDGGGPYETRTLYTEPCGSQSNLQQVLAALNDANRFNNIASVYEAIKIVQSLVVK